VAKKKTFLILQAGLRTLHEKGPELKRAISGQLDEMLEQVSWPVLSFLYI